MDSSYASGRQSTDGTETIGRAQTGAGASLGDTVTGLIQDLQDIIRGEVQLAKTEIKEDTSKLGKALGMIGASALIGLVGFIFVMLSLTYLLNKSMEMWLAAGIVGLALLVIGAILVILGKNQMQQANLKPAKTIESLKEDKEWASHQINSVKK
jgi:uncharacterized membrane protein YqjE